MVALTCPTMTTEAKLGQNFPRGMSPKHGDSFALRCSVGNLADARGVSTGSPEHTQETGVPKPPQVRLLISELTFWIQFLSCSGVARNVNIHCERVHRSSYNVQRNLQKINFSFLPCSQAGLEGQFMSTTSLLLGASLKLILKFPGLLVPPHAPC